MRSGAIKEREVEALEYRCGHCGVAGIVWEYKGQDLCGLCLSRAEGEEKEASRGRPAGRGEFRQKQGA